MEETCKIPMHIACELSKNGYVKQLALFLSLKKIYSSSHIWDFKKVDLSKIGYQISRPTYLKYLRILELIGLVKGDQNGGMILLGMDKLIKQYPVPDDSKLKFVILKNDKKLRDSLEQITLKKCIEAQVRKMEDPLSHNKFVTLSIKVGERAELSAENIRYQTSVSCKHLAALIGLRSAMTGVRRQRKWVKEGFIKTQRRLLVICSRKVRGAKDIFRSHPLNFILGDNICRPIANQIVISDNTVGRRQKNENLKFYEMY